MTPLRHPRNGYVPARPRRRLLRRLAFGLVGLLVVLTGTAYGAYRYYNGKVTRIGISSLRHGSTTPTVNTGQYFLIAGSDTRAIPDGASFQSTTASTAVTGQRADTVILVHIPTGSAKATLVSFPRDSYVQIPAYTDSAGVTTAAHYAKLNEAYSIGGPDLLVKTIESISGLPIDHYMQVNFDGFRQIVDAVGGVTLCVGTTRNDKDSGDYLTAGIHKNVSGDQALAFVRDRKGLAAGDLARIADQQYFLSQVYKKVMAAGTLANPVRLTSLLSATTQALTVDKGFGLSDFRALASRLRSLDATHVTFLTLPISTPNGWRLIHGLNQSVVLLDDTKLPQTFQALSGKAPSPGVSATRTPSTTATPTPSSTPAVKGTSAAAATCAV
ncbi:MAG: cell envelope-related transcriptional attenuator [Frankiales bacterium]|nr:cell envelope-related transcriptional attenuator [Frankiales bacterium]